MEKKKIGKCVQCGNSILLDSNMSKDFNSYCYDCLLDIDLKDLKRDFNDLTDFTEGQIFTNDCAKGIRRSNYSSSKKSKKEKSNSNEEIDEDEKEEDTKEKWLQEASQKMEAKGTKGSFTEYCGGEVTEACIAKAKKSGDKGLVKKAMFAENVRGITKKKKKKKDMEIDIDDKRPPKEWWNACQKRIKQSNPNYSQEQVNKTCGMIYHKRGVRKVMDMNNIIDFTKMNQGSPLQFGPAKHYYGATPEREKKRKNIAHAQESHEMEKRKEGKGPLAREKRKKYARSKTAKELGYKPDMENPLSKSSENDITKNAFQKEPIRIW